ncbi:MAG: hypothetical protein IBJ10_01275 [Phycisphaerales bacterium]|nr:hypothetical protein [Phycisphaerales bacterium]
MTARAARPNLPAMPDLMTEHQRMLLVTRAVEEVRAGDHPGPALAAMSISHDTFLESCWAYIALNWSAERIGEAAGVIAAPEPAAKKKAGARGKGAAAREASKKAKATNTTALRNFKRALATVKNVYLKIYREEVSRLASEARCLTLTSEPAETARNLGAMLAARLHGALNDQKSFDALDRHEKHVLLRGVHLLMESPRLSADAELREAKKDKIISVMAALADKAGDRPGGSVTREDIVNSFVEAGLGKDIAEALRKRKAGAA